MNLELINQYTLHHYGFKVVDGFSFDTVSPYQDWRAEEELNHPTDLRIINVRCLTATECGYSNEEIARVCSKIFNEFDVPSYFPLKLGIRVNSPSDVMIQIAARSQAFKFIFYR
jgi:hypothetical protein